MRAKSIAMADDYDNRFAALQQDYLERVAGHVERLEELGTGLRAGVDRETFDELHGLVHRLAGTGETMGFPAIGRAAQSLEAHLEAADGPAELAGGEAAEAVEAFCDRLRDILEAQSEP